ncbi:hypothetical protein RB623_29245 [Mesorhizobium sp. LHD-90]|uniref:hypothetical protein n=1 Tax=Mesorhizobium sp. LHD-90 TaxID=3071414 RepID=UPI0027E175D8|nr:hypothetical protein [Mesorhizobium sp. LHD-90]MDQ6438159.1 hypothetical protein [Mesorhizobium sp. LHD-90]
MLPFLTLLAKPFLGRLPVPEAAKKKVAAMNSLLTGGFGESWLPVARHQTTLPTAWPFRLRPPTTICRSGCISTRSPTSRKA